MQQGLLKKKTKNKQSKKKATLLLAAAEKHLSYLLVYKWHPQGMHFLRSLHFLRETLSKIFEM